MNTTGAVTGVFWGAPAPGGIQKSAVTCLWPNKKSLATEGLHPELFTEDQFEIV